MQCRLIAGGEDAGAFQRDIDITPRQLFWVANGGYSNFAFAHDNAVFGRRNRDREAPVHAIILQKVCVCFDRAQIVDCDHFDIGAPAFNDRPQDIPANSSETIDTDFDGHSHLQFC